MSNGIGAYGVRLVRWIGLAMVLPALIAVALLAKDASIVVQTINENALKREKQALDHGIRLLGELHATELLQQTMWDAAFRNVVVSQKHDWIRKTFGKDAVSAESLQRLYIVDPAGKVIFASAYEAKPPAAEARELLAVAKAPIARARDLYHHARDDGGNFDERLPGAMTDGIYVNDLITFAGQPAMITVSPFTPDVADVTAPAEPTLLVGVQTMTEGLLDRLEQLSHIDDLEHVTPRNADAAAEHVHAIRDSRGNVITRVTWDYASPGETILRAALPTIAVSLLLIAMLTALAATTMRRLTRRLAESEQAALYASRHDAATGLANRGWFMRVFQDLLAPAGNAPSTRAVMLIDCDYFKSVNDTLGHAAGDAVLAAIAERLRALGDRLTIAARLGGDEFALVTAPLAAADDAAAAMHEVETALAKPVLFDVHLIAVSVSIGAATVTAPSGDTIDTWLARADAALYRAKRDGRGCARLYDSVIDTGVANDPPPASGESDDRPRPTPARAA